MTQPSGHGSKVTLVIAVLGVIAAIMTVAAGVLAYQTAGITKQKEEAQSSAASSDETVADVRRENESLKAKITQLESGANIPGPTGSLVPPAAPTVRNDGSITLAAKGYRGDLDSLPSDPQWQSGDGEVSYEPGYFRVFAPVIRLGQKKADLDLCRTTTGYVGSRDFATSTIAVGDYFCIKTSDKRYSAVELTGLTPQSAVIDVVTYDPPF